MDQLREMQTFLRVVQSKSFSTAARQLGVSRSTVTKVIAGLEQRLGANLLVRSPHHVTVTNTGELFATEARAILARVEELNQRVEEKNAELKGEIKIGAPTSFSTMHLVRAIQDFRAVHPSVSFDHVNDRGDLSVVREGFDLSIRIAPALPDMALVSQLLVRVPQVLVGASSYLDKYGRPGRKEDLVNHQCLVHTVKSRDGRWVFEDGDVVYVTGALKSDIGEVLRQAARRGEGLSVHPTYMVYEDLRSGDLERVLPEHRLEEMSIYAVYPEKHYRPQRVIQFLDFFKTWLRSMPDWNTT